MKLQWRQKRCIVCLRETVMTREHIIPRSIGGRLELYFLCKRCNDEIGAEVEASAKQDVSIRIAVEHLVSRMPKLAAQVRENQKYRGKSAGGSAPGRVRGGVFRVDKRRAPDGSIVLPTRDARKLVERRLSRRKFNPDDIEDALNVFDGATDGARMKLDSIEFTKWTVTDLTPILDGKPLSDLVLLKIAYEFLACHIGAVVFERRPFLESIRYALQERGTTDVIRIDRLHAQHYEPFHGLALEQKGDDIFVLIRLFGWLAFRVHFLPLRYNGPRCAYRLDLETSEERLDPIGWATTT